MSLTAPTHHITCMPGEIAQTVLMPGDPLRAKYMAEHYLENAKLVNEVRCMYAYTGLYKGKKLSIMASGMGGPSLAAMVYELYALYDVERIIRVGTAGALSRSLDLFDVVIAMGACHDSSFHRQYHLPGTFAPIASYPLMSQAVSCAEKLEIPYAVGNIFSANAFYCDDPADHIAWSGMGALCVDCETATLYMLAARAQKQAVSLLAVSDFMEGEKAKLTAQERQDGCGGLMRLAVETAWTSS